MKKEYGKNKDKLEKLLREGNETKGPVVSIEPQVVSNSRNLYNPQINSGNFISQSADKMLNLGKQKLFGFLGIPTKYDEISYYSKWWKFYDNCVTIANISLILMVFYDYEINYTYPRHIVVAYTHTRLIMISIAFTCIFCVIKRHYMKHKWRNIKLQDKFYGEEQNYDDDTNIEDIFFEEDRLVLGGKKTKLLTTALLLDVLTNLIMPYPLLDFHIHIKELDRDENKIVDIDYLLSDFIYMVVLLRSLYIVRALINYSMFSDLYANQLCKEHQVANNNRFVLKCLFKVHHIKLVMWVFLGSVLLFGFMLRIVERPFWTLKGRIEFENYGTAAWCIFITMLTIGYGDYSPQTFLGKIIVFIAGLWGVFVTSLIIVSLHGLLELSSDQFNAFTKRVKSQVAIQFIESAYVFHRNRSYISKRNIYETKKNYQDVLLNYSCFKNMRNESKSIYRSNGLLHYNIKLLHEMKKVNQRVIKIGLDLEAAREVNNIK